MNKKSASKHSALPKMLTILVVISSLIVAFVGCILKYTICRSAGILQDTSAIAVPFILMEDVSMREAIAQSSSKDKKPDGITIAGDKESSSSEAESSSSPADDTPASYHLGPVTEDYWDGVLFIGDSRTEGLKLYAPMAKADYFAGSSFSSYDVLDPSVTSSQTGHFDTCTLEQLLSSKNYHAVYIMLGINEIGHSMDGIQMMHQKLIDKIHELQPGVPIVLQASIRVTKAFSEGKEDFALYRFEALDETLAAMADNKTIFFINGNFMFLDEEGYLDPKYTGDGSHPYAANYETYKNWLMENGVQ